MPTRYVPRGEGITDPVYTKEVGYTTRTGTNGGYFEERRSTSRGYSSSDRYGTNGRPVTEERPEFPTQDRRRPDQDEWERKTIVLEKASKDQSFGIAVSGGKDNPHFQSGDTSIVVSDVLKGSPADGLLKIDDVITSVNNQSVENETHAFAVRCLKESGRSVKLCIRRRLSHGIKQSPAREVITKVTKEEVPRYSEKQAPPYRSPPQHVAYEERRYKVDGHPVETRTITETREFVKPPEYRPPSHASSHVKGRDSPSLHRQSPREEVAQQERVRKSDEPISVILQRNDLEPYGFSVGSQFFIQDVDRIGPASRDGTLEPGDIICKINGTSTSNLRLTEVIDKVKNSPNRLHLTVQKKNPMKSWVQAPVEEEGPPLPERLYDHEEVTITSKGKGEARLPDDEIDSGRKMKTKGLYDKALEAAEETGAKEDLEALNRFKSDDYEISRTWRSPVSAGLDAEMPQEEVPPRSSLVDEEHPTQWVKGYVPDSPRSSRSGGTLDRKDKKIRVGDGRLVTFRKEGGVGIQVAGGNQCGIFVAKVREGTPAANANLSEGDQIIMANDIDFRNITREEAVLALLSLDDDVRLIVQHRRTAFEKVKRDPGDSFFIKTHFDYEGVKDDELSFKKGDILHVWDTMYNGVVGSWQAQEVARNGTEGKIGLIPNRCRASQLALAQHLAESKGIVVKTPTSSMKRKSTLNKDRKKFISLDELDDKSFVEEEKSMNVPAYEKVNLKEATFMRPVILLGPTADIARDKLLKEEPEKFALPEAVRDEAEKQQGGAPRRGISLSSIRSVTDANKHCLLDVTPDAVDKINYAQLYPIVIYFKTAGTKAIREIREKALNEKQQTKLIKRLHTSSQMLERNYTHMFSTVINVTATGGWIQKLKNNIDTLQAAEVWMSQDQVVEQEEMVFPQRQSFISVGDYDSTLDSMGIDSSTIRSSTDEPYPEDHAPEPPVRDMHSMNVNYAPDDDVFTERSDDRYDSKDRWFDDNDRHPDHDQVDARYIKEREFGRHPQYDDKDRYDSRGPYDERDGYDQREPEPFMRYTRREEYIEGPSRPGYKPTGNIVKVLPSSEIAQEVRRSLRKTSNKNEWSSSETDSDLVRAADGLRPTERIEKDKSSNELEMEIKQKATALRRVEPESELFKEYDDRAGVKVSDLWAIDNDYRRSVPQSYSSQQDRTQPPDYDDHREAVIKARNTVVDSRRENQEVMAQARYMPTKSYATVTRYDPDSGRDKDRGQFEVEKETVKRYERRYEPSQPTRDFDRSDGTPPQRPIEEAIKSLQTKETEGVPHYVSHFSFSQKQERDAPPEHQPEPHQTSYSGSLPRPYGTSYSKQDAPRTFDYEHKYTKQEPSKPSGGYSSTTTTTTTYTKKETVIEPDKIDDSQNAVTSDFESVDDDHQVIATAKGMFNNKGGVLSSPESGVSIYIPEGAIPDENYQEIYFKVCKDNNFLPPLDTEKGETILSPLVMCGPHGTKFSKPVELRLPHCAAMSPDGWSFALKSSDAQSGEGGQSWQNMPLDDKDKEMNCQVDSNSVSVLVKHFSWFTFSGIPNPQDCWL